MDVKLKTNTNTTKTGQCCTTDTFVLKAIFATSI